MSSGSPTLTVTRAALIALALTAVAALLWMLADAVIVAFGGIVVGAALRALMDPLIKRTGWKDRWALLTVLAALTLLAALLFWLFGLQAANQFAEMREQLPMAVEKLKAWLAESRIGRQVVEYSQQAAGESSPLSSAGSAAGAALGGLGHLLVILFVGVYLAADPKLYRDGALRLLPVSRREQVGRALDEAGIALRKWLVAQLIVMGAVALLITVGLWLAKVPMSLSLGLVAGVFEFVPVLGPVLAMVPAVLLAFAQSPQVALYVLGLFLVVQQIESNLLTPLIQRWAVELPPVIALLSIVAGGLLFGFLGAIFATPLAVVVMTLVRCLYVEDTLESGRSDHRRSRPRRVPAVETQG